MSWNGQPNMEVHHATAYATTDPGIFSLEGLDFNTFLQDSPGEIELSMGRQDMPYALDIQSAPYAQLASLFSGYEFVDINGASSSQTTDNTSSGSGTIFSSQLAAPPAFFNNEHESSFSRSSSSSTVPQQTAMSPQSFYSHSLEGSRTSSTSSFAISQQHQYNPSYDQDAMQQFFNFDAPSNLSPIDHNTTPPRPAPPSHAPMTYTAQRISPPKTPQHASYAPPSAAANNGSRRVA